MLSRVEKHHLKIRVNMTSHRLFAPSKEGQPPTGQNLIGGLLLLALILGTYTPLLAQPRGANWYYLQNVQTGLIIDVNGGLKQKGTTVWPYSLNFSEAQIFRFDRTDIPNDFGNNANYIMSYVPSGPAVFLSAKIPARVNSPDGSAADTGPISAGNALSPISQNPQVATDGRNTDQRNLLRRYVFTVEDKMEYTTPRFDGQSSLEGESRQIWKVTPVPGETDFYYIENGHFEDRFLVEPLDLQSGGTLVLGEFRGDALQQWRILKTQPNEVTNVGVSNFKWKRKFHYSTWKVWKWGNKHRFTGKVSWDTDNPAATLAKQELVIRNSKGFIKTISLTPGHTSYEFSFVIDSEPDNDQYCFRLTSFSKWSVENRAFTDELCELPAGPTNTPPTTGDVISFASSLKADIPLSGNIVYLGQVQPNNNSRLTKVHVAGNSFTPYIVQFLPEGKTREDCGTDVGVRIEPGEDLEGDDLATLYGENRPKTPVFFGACKLNRSAGQLNTNSIPIQIDYIKE
ncbi:MAG: hypothetical protein WA952_14045 [Lewinella sp.]